MMAMAMKKWRNQCEENINENVVSIIVVIISMKISMWQ